MRITQIMAATAAIVILLAACGSDAAEDGAHSPAITAPDTDAVVFRPVLALLPTLATRAPDRVDLPAGLDENGLTDPISMSPTDEVVLAEFDDGTITARYLLGPTLVTGSAVETAEPVLDQLGEEWTVRLVFREGPDGIDVFNRAAALCHAMSVKCPEQTLAIVFEGEVLGTPTINAPEFERDLITISDVTEGEARTLAAALTPR